MSGWGSPSIGSRIELRAETQTSGPVLRARTQVDRATQAMCRPPIGLISTISPRISSIRASGWNAPASTILSNSSIDIR